MHTDAHPRTIRVVDNQDSIRKLVRRLLEAAGYTVILAADGAMRLAVLSDITTLGDELARQVKLNCGGCDQKAARPHLPRTMAQTQTQTLDGLTSRETEVLVLIAEGLSSKRIAQHLRISFKTVVCHRSRLMDKLDVHETASLVRYAIRQKLIEP